MSDLVAFLRECFDADERVAKEVDPDGRLGSLDDSDDGFESRLWPDHNFVGITACRVLAEVEAKRRIVELHAAEPGQHPDFCWHDKHELPCPTLRLLALPYRDRPGYDPAWSQA